jgi:hypothetical protein
MGEKLYLEALRGKRKDEGKVNKFKKVNTMKTILRLRMIRRSIHLSARNAIEASDNLVEA